MELDPVFALVGCPGEGALMEVFERVNCPFCGQSFELSIDTTVPFQRFTTDCEVCCRPFQVSAECEAGEVLGVEISAD